MIGLRERVLEKLAYKYYLKNPERSAKENWTLAQKLLAYIDKRRTLVEKILKSSNFLRN